MKVFTYKGDKVRLTQREYGNKRTALTMESAIGEPYMKISVNVDDVPIRPNQIVVKDYSENEGILHWLQDNNIVSAPIGGAKVGHVFCPLVELLPKEEWKGEELSEKEINEFYHDYLF
jgi:hypothetical protein